MYNTCVFYRVDDRFSDVNLANGSQKTNARIFVWGGFADYFTLQTLI